jgi:hypothetical protein
MTQIQMEHDDIKKLTYDIMLLVWGWWMMLFSTCKWMELLTHIFLLLRI